MDGLAVFEAVSFIFVDSDDALLVFRDHGDDRIPIFLAVLVEALELSPKVNEGIPLH